jgi:hypothetical protein
VGVDASCGYCIACCFACPYRLPSPYIYRFLSADTIVPGYANPTGHMFDEGCSTGCTYTPCPTPSPTPAPGGANQYNCFTNPSSCSTATPTPRSSSTQNSPHYGQAVGGVLLIQMGLTVSMKLACLDGIGNGLCHFSAKIPQRFA